MSALSVPGAVVMMVRTAVPEVMPEMLTGLVEPKLNEGGFLAPLGLEVIAAVNVTLPVKPATGATVMVAVLSACAGT